MATEQKNYHLLVGIVALILIILMISVIGYFVSKPKPIVIQGEVEATEYRVSGKVPGRIEELYAREGQQVQKGDTLVHIDSPEVRAKLAQAQGALSAARAQSNMAQNGARKEQITGAYELWQQAKVQEEVMRKSFERVQKLYDQKVISAQKYDETKAKYDASVAQANAAKSQYDMACNGAREEDKQAAAALVERANGAMMEVEAYLGELYLTSPNGFPDHDGYGPRRCLVHLQCPRRLSARHETGRPAYRFHSRPGRQRMHRHHQFHGCPRVLCHLESHQGNRCLRCQDL